MHHDVIHHSLYERRGIRIVDISGRRLFHFKSSAPNNFRDGVHSPLRAAVVPDPILDPSVADHPHHRDTIADPDFDCECVGALAVPRHPYLAIPFTAVYLAASRCFGAGVDEAVLLNDLVEVLVCFFDCH